MTTPASPVSIPLTYQRLHLLCTVAAARAKTDAERLRWVDRQNQLFALSVVLTGDDAGGAVDGRQLPDSENRLLSHYIALQTAPHLD